jgi:hypothetical protein
LKKKSLNIEDKKDGGRGGGADGRRAGPGGGAGGAAEVDLVLVGGASEAVAGGTQRIPTFW